MCGAFMIVYKYLVVNVTFCKALFVCDRVCSMETSVIKHACMLVLAQVCFFVFFYQMANTNVPYFSRLSPGCPKGSY